MKPPEWFSVSVILKVSLTFIAFVFEVVTQIGLVL